MASRIRVLFLIPALRIAGAERQLFELVKRMDRDRFEVHLVVSYDPGTEDNFWSEAARVPDLHLHSLHKRRGVLGYLTSLPRLLRLIVVLSPDILHGYMADGNLPLLLLGGLLRKRVVWGIRRSNRDLAKVDRREQGMLRLAVWLSRYVDLIIFNSESGRANHAAMGMKAARMEVVANGFDVAGFRPDPALGAAQREAWAIPEGAPLIGIVGRLVPVKDHPTFLRAAARLAGSWPNAWFVCVGTGPEPYPSALRALAVNLGIGDRVRFAAVSQEMTGVYNALSCLVLSSTDEGFPNVLGEAMACGVPCVTTRVGDAEFLVGPCGIVVDPGDEAAIAEAVATLLVEPAPARAARSEASRARICASFSVDALTRNTERLLLDLGSDAAALGALAGDP